MTIDHLPGQGSSGIQQESSAGTKRKRSSTCHASFTKDEVRVVVEQPADGVGKGCYNSAQRQCLLHMISSPPSNFDCETSGKVSAPRTEVVLQRGVLEKLPLLLDISKHSSTEGTSTDLELPCSVWGFISLLLVLEGSVKLNHWFGRDSDPSLPSQTLLAADFMACRDVRKDIIEHLQTLLIDSIEQGEKTKRLGAQGSSSDAQLSLAVQQAYARDWHSTQILRHVPETYTADIFYKLNRSCDSTMMDSEAKGILAGRAMHLPQDLLVRWVASASPVLDLRNAWLTALQWSRLFNAIAQGGDNITEFHVCGATSMESAHSEIRSFGRRLQAQLPYINRRACIRSICSPNHQGYTFGTTPTRQGVGVIALCTDSECCKHVAHVKQSPCMPASEFCEQLCGGRVNVTDCSHMLNTLAGVLPQLRSLQHVGLHNLSLHPQLMPALGKALLDLPPSVTTLTIDVPQAMYQGLVQRGMLFSAIALARGLRELHMPDWEDLVEEDSACMEPLYGLPHLEVVYVSVVKKNDAFPRGLTFKALEDAEAAPSMMPS